jgi:hypothetical protein
MARLLDKGQQMLRLGEETTRLTWKDEVSVWALFLTMAEWHRVHSLG